MIYVTALTQDPSEESIKKVVAKLKGKLTDFETSAQLELIAMAVEPVHPGITEKIHQAL